MTAGRLRVWHFSLVIDQAPGVRQTRDLGAGSTVVVGRDRSARVQFAQPARSLHEAIAAGVRRIERVGLRAVRVDAADWLTLGDIARRIGRSRETVRLWAAGRVGPGGFPPPLNPGGETAYYSWAEVQPWLRTRMGLDLADEEPVLAAANLALQLRALAPRLTATPVIRWVPRR